MKTVIYLQTLIVILSFLFHSCSSEEVDKCDKEIITFLPAVSVSTRSTMEQDLKKEIKLEFSYLIRTKLQSGNMVANVG